MFRKSLLLSSLLAVGIVVSGCGSKPAGPDQTLVAPEGWTIADHEPGNLNESRWTLEKGETKMELVSYRGKDAPEDTLSKMAQWKLFMQQTSQEQQFLTRTWATGKFQAVRYFGFESLSQKNHGTAYIWLINADREFAITITNLNMTREPLVALAEKAADDIANVNGNDLVKN